MSTREEPLPPSHPLLALPNVVLTPHIGWIAEDSYRVFIEGVVENILAYLDGRPVPFPLNPDALQHRAAPIAPDSIRQTGDASNPP